MKKITFYFFIDDLMIHVKVNWIMKKDHTQHRVNYKEI